MRDIFESYRLGWILLLFSWADNDSSDIHPFGPQYLADISLILYLYTFLHIKFSGAQNPKPGIWGFPNLRIECLKRYRRGYDPFLEKGSLSSFPMVRNSLPSSGIWVIICSTFFVHKLRPLFPSSFHSIHFLWFHELSFDCFSLEATLVNIY
jgi:hypothetical protein